MQCYEAMNKHRILLRQAPPSEILDQMCAAVFVEAQDIEDKHFPQLKQDLFMEQGEFKTVVVLYQGPRN